MPATSSWLSRTSLQVGRRFLGIWYRMLISVEIYRIVSSKALDNGEGGQQVLDRRPVIDPSKQDSEQKPGCC